MSAIDVAKTLADLAVQQPTEFVRADARYASHRQDAGLLFERRLDPVSLMPLSLSASEDAAVRAAAADILSVLDTAADLYRQDAAVRVHFPAYREAETLLLADPGIRPTAGVFRLDGVLTEAGDFKMIEASKASGRVRWIRRRVCVCRRRAGPADSLGRTGPSASGCFLSPRKAVWNWSWTASDSVDEMNNSVPIDSPERRALGVGSVSCTLMDPYAAAQLVASSRST